MKVGGDYRLGSADPVMIVEMAVTSWCNYRCAYCITTVQPKREQAVHAFDRHSVDAWVNAFARVPSELSLVCRGGEPFLDHEGFAPFLARVGALPRMHYIRVDTNGSWSPARYESVPAEVRARVQLNVSFHPTQIELDDFAKRIDRILAAGWQIGMINYVMERAQAADYERVRDFFRDRAGVYVNPNPDAFDPAWRAAGEPRDDGRRRLATWIPELDVARKTGALTLGKTCAYPAIGFMINADGRAARSCGVMGPGEPRWFDFIAEPHLVRPLTSAVRCPQRGCLCLDRYAFLDEAETRGRDFDLLGEYVRDCRAVQAAE